MIYFLLFYEFFLIGLMAIGGGLVTIPFLINLSETRGWFSLSELTDMIAVSESTPGPIGVNMATFVGYKTADIWGGIVATFGLTLPSFLILLLFSKYIMQYKTCVTFQNILFGIRPAALALILYAGIVIAKLSLTNWKIAGFTAGFFILQYFFKKSPILYIILGAVTGIVFRL